MSSLGISDVLVPGPIVEIFNGRLALIQSSIFTIPLCWLNVQTRIVFVRDAKITEAFAVKLHRFIAHDLLQDQRRRPCTDGQARPA